VHYLAFNLKRPALRDPAVRRAINLAIDRPALAATDGERPWSHYLPPMPGVQSDVAVYPSQSPTAADIARAKTLLRGRHITATLETGQLSAYTARAHILQTDLRRIGIKLHIHTYNSEQSAPGADYDILDTGWIADVYDPANFLIYALFNRPGTFGWGGFTSPKWWHKAEAANELTPPDRNTTFGHLELSLMRGPIPWAAYGLLQTPAFISARLGCIHTGPYGVDLAALCLRH
jgi:peptide/nickel transport system substrate-binding protein